MVGAFHVEDVKGYTDGYYPIEFSMSKGGAYLIIRALALYRKTAELAAGR